MNTKFYVQIIRYEDDGLEKELGPMAEREAEKADSGLDRQLDHKNFYTLIVSEEERQHGA